MRVVLHLSKFYNWDQVPPGTVVTEVDVARGKVMPGREPGTWRMKVAKNPPNGAATTHHELMLSERDLIEKIIEEKADIRKGGRTLSRAEALAAFITDHVLAGSQYPTHGAFEPEWITKIEVHDDGPHEELFREVLAIHAAADHGRPQRVGTKNVPPAHVDDHVTKYLEPMTADAHVLHLHKFFGVK